jgi:hypothetical protein
MFRYFAIFQVLALSGARYSSTTNTEVPGSIPGHSLGFF